MDPNTDPLNQNQPPQPTTPQPEPTSQPALNPEPPSLQSNTPATPPVVVGGPGESGAPLASVDETFNAMSTPPEIIDTGRSKKPLFIGLGVLLLLILGGLIYYFGYYMNPKVVLAQSLSNTSKGYDKLIDYADTQAKIGYKGSEGSGTFSLKSDSFTTDGSFSTKNYESNSETKLDVGLATTRLKADVITIDSKNSQNPDIYLKAEGIKGLGALAGSPEMGVALDKLEGQWIAIDHTFIDNLENMTKQSGGGKIDIKAPPKEDILSTAKAIGEVNKQYVFTTKEQKSIAVVVKNLGTEKINGRKTYHYKMAFNKDNVKTYIGAQHDAIKSSKVWAWMKKNSKSFGKDSTATDKQLDESFRQLQKDADKIKSSDTFDLWTDVNRRVIYKVRVNDKKNPATNYVDGGLNYQGGSQYPFFVNIQSKDKQGSTQAAFVVTLDTNKNSLNFKLNGKNDGQDSGELKLDMTFRPNSNPVEVSPPKNAKSINEVLQALGISNLLNSLQSSSTDIPVTSDQSNGASTQ